MSEQMSPSIILNRCDFDPSVNGLKKLCYA